MKKGGLYVIGTNVSGDLSNPGMAEWLENQQLAWLSLVELLGVKAFIETTVDKNIRNGLQNLILTAGLGGMTPNTVVMGFYDQSEPKNFLEDPTALPKKKNLFLKLRRHRDDDRGYVDRFKDMRVNDEGRITPEDYIGVITDALSLRKNVCLMRNFQSLQRPVVGQQQFIDVWPIAPDTNYNSHIEDDTTSMFILQLSCILHMVGTWGTTSLRVMATSPTEELGATEKVQLKGILQILRIEADVHSVIMPDILLKETTTIDRYKILNNAIRENSHNTLVTFLYLPEPPANPTQYTEYLEQLSAVTDDLPPTLLVRGLSRVTTHEL